MSAAPHYRFLESEESLPWFSIAVSIINYTFWDPPSVSPPHRLKEQLDKGCYRMRPDTFHDQPDDWYARLSQQRPETVGPTGAPKKKPRQRSRK